ncbi:hypothetical protein ACVWYG_003730 [Pedobacter sp. UYEF25]
MLREIFKQKDLPINVLAKIGLVNKGNIVMDMDDLHALLSGKRTDMISLKNLSAGSLNIDQLDAKISLKPNAKGKLDLLIHPIYREPNYPPFLTNLEAQNLESGEKVNLYKTTLDEAGNKKEILVEFDRDTKEFILTDTQKITVPDMVNNEKLTAEQKDRYKKGKEVELQDGAVFQMSNVDRRGIVSSKSALIVSLLLDGGISYLLMNGLNALIGKERDELKSKDYGKGYEQAFRDMKSQSMKDKMIDKNPDTERVKSNEYFRGYNRSGTSR